MENWDTYVANYENNKPGSTTLRLDLIKSAPLADYPILLILGVGFQSRMDDGFPEAESLESVYEISERLMNYVLENRDGILVGSFLHNNERIEYFYLKEDNNFADSIKEFAAATFPDQKIGVKISPDKDWNCYKDFLYPSGEILDFMSDQNLVKRLQESGDNLQIPRRVEHFIYFKEEGELNCFKLACEELGFKMNSAKFVDNQSAPYELVVYRREQVELNFIHPVANELRNLAKEHDGIYDGWETVVIKDLKKS